MTGVDVILTALGAGASAGLSGMASSTVTDAYTTLKRLLSRRLAATGETVTVDADSPPPEAPLRDALTRSGASADEAVLVAAERLLALISQENSTTITVAINHGAVGTFNAPVSFTLDQRPVPPGSS